MNSQANDKAYMQKTAMLMGTFLGIFWIAKFALFPIGVSSPVVMFAFIILTLYTPFLVYKFAKSYRDSTLGGHIGFTHAYIFSALTYMYAAMLTAVAHYIYFQFIDNGYLQESYAILLDSMSRNADGQANTAVFKEAIEALMSLSASDITIELFSQNIFNGIIVSLPIALLVKRNQ